MKILYISYNGILEPLFQSQGLPYIMAARKKGYDFSILTFETAENTGKCNPLFLKMRDKLSEAGIAWRYLRFHRRPGFFAKAYDLIAGIVTSLIISAEAKPDAIQARGLFSALAALPASFITRKPLIFDTRSKLSEAYAISGKWKKGGVVSRSMGFLEDRCVCSAKAVVCETTDHRTEIEEFLSRNKMKKHLEVIPCCVDLERFKGAADTGKKGPGFVISYLGSLSGWYCLKETVSFFEEMNKVLPGSRMIFLTKDDPGVIVKYIKESALPGNAVEIFGVSPDSVPRHLASSSAGIVFKYPDQRLSSFPIKIGEYLASGIPVVINRGMGDAEDFILDNGVGVAVDGFDEGAFSKGIAALR
ncbi:MAG: hypothetical protein PHN63_03290, partial [Candidatus Omnitrophica bacterium]|nr:hypothetical protein [Candidatus Omnitrophota bacterium]